LAYPLFVTGYYDFPAGSVSWHFVRNPQDGTVLGSLERLDLYIEFVTMHHVVASLAPRLAFHREARERGLR